MSKSEHLKPILWIASSKRDLMQMPQDVITDFGFGLYQAQLGEYPDTAKTLHGFGGTSVVELGPVPKFIMPRFEIISRAGCDERVGVILKILPLPEGTRSSQPARKELESR